MQVICGVEMRKLKSLGANIDHSKYWSVFTITSVNEEFGGSVINKLGHRFSKGAVPHPSGH